MTLEAKETGFYYFIFANENELTDNFLFADFRLHKTAFDVSPNHINCTNATECHFPLSFWYAAAKADQRGAFFIAKKPSPENVINYQMPKSGQEI